MIKSNWQFKEKLNKNVISSNFDVSRTIHFIVTFETSSAGTVVGNIITTTIITNYSYLLLYLTHFLFSFNINNLNNNRNTAEGHSSKNYILLPH